MSLNGIEISRFRCLSEARLEFDRDQNLILGANAAGKTSILEAIYFLGSGRSFRSPSCELLIQRGESSLAIVGFVENAFGVVSTMGVGATKAKREFRINGSSSAGLVEFAKAFPVQIIDPDLHGLIEDGPSRRRQFVDWGAFHVEHGFGEIWRRYVRALNQRNAALKSRFQPFDVWDGELSVAAEQVSLLRQRYLDSLRPFITTLGRNLMDADLDCAYLQGWPTGLAFAESLIRARERDLFRGTTSVGPHRAELVVRIDDHEARGQISRGQQKLLSCILILAQQLHFAECGKQRGCLLLDDPAAELDVDNLGKLFEIVSTLPVQLIVTSLSDAGLSFMKKPKTFHVERGTIKPVA